LAKAQAGRDNPAPALKNRCSSWLSVYAFARQLPQRASIPHRQAAPPQFLIAVDDSGWMQPWKFWSAKIDEPFPTFRTWIVWADCFLGRLPEEDLT
jgi:hypothetical protein